MTLGIVLEVLEILRRTPGWLLFVIAMPVFLAIYIVVLHPWWTATIAVLVIAMTLVRRGRDPRRTEELAAAPVTAAASEPWDEIDDLFRRGL